jgi:uncharacterized protein (TIGR03084 family)
MRQLLAEVRVEYEELTALLDGLASQDWDRRTAFFGWTVADEVMHLHLIDSFGVVAVTDRDDFMKMLADIRALQADGVELSAQMRMRYGALAPAALLASWQAGYADMLARFAAADGESRMPWFGPDMSVDSFAAARQMEVWAHGQDIYDALRIRRVVRDTVRNICDLGVRTQGWSFRNRQLDRPPPPHVRLIAPSGAVWSWNDGAADSIIGPAEDFALIVTQRRHVDDTRLELDGAGARQWMEIAQCFAGPPETGPAAGERAVAFAQ